MGDTTYVPLITVQDMPTLVGNESSSNTALTGSGTPEGVVAAGIGRHYWDHTNEIDYVKQTGTGITGWIQFV